jgi:hypothetical protein
MHVVTHYFLPLCKKNAEFFFVADDLTAWPTDRHADNGLSTEEKGIKGLFVHNLGPISEIYFTIQHPIKQK